MRTITTIGIDLAKKVFQIHGVDAEGKVVVARKLRRKEVLAFFAKLAPCLVGMEACGSAPLGEPRGSFATRPACSGARAWRSSPARRAGRSAPHGTRWHLRGWPSRRPISSGGVRGCRIRGLANRRRAHDCNARARGTRRKASRGCGGADGMMLIGRSSRRENLPFVTGVEPT